MQRQRGQIQCEHERKYLWCVREGTPSNEALLGQIHGAFLDLNYKMKKKNIEISHKCNRNLMSIANFLGGEKMKTNTWFAIWFHIRQIQM